MMTVLPLNEKNILVIEYCKIVAFPRYLMIDKSMLSLHDDYPMLPHCLFPIDHKCVGEVLLLSVLLTVVEFHYPIDFVVDEHCDCLVKGFVV